METSKDYVISLLKEKYDYEMNRKNDFEASLGIPITVLSALFAGIYFVISDTSLKDIDCSLITIKWILVILLLCSCILTLVMLFVVYFGFRRRYCVFPESDIVYNVDFRELDVYTKEYFNDKYEETITSHLKDRVIKWYLDCNNNNTPVNDKRGNALFYAKLFICISLSLGLAMLILICLIKTI